VDSVKNYYSQNRPTVLERIKKFSGKKSLIFKSRQEADGFLAKLRSENVIAHYDALIDEGNDPVTDPKPLKDYMDKWDGQTFIDKMQLTPEKSVLEIGVGTGRLALRVAPFCEEFTGIDISPKTIVRARENLSNCKNLDLICGDFLAFDFDQAFDVIYSSLTFLHIKEKQDAIIKVFTLLNPNGRFVLSIDKNQDKYIDFGKRKLAVYPDKPDEIESYLKQAGFDIEEISEAEFAYIFTAIKR
ncbi:MAG: methyltransferase domain-containing protein, partial [Clostridia bacterium]|nr:methyltransferase domain-containing protein [Clostridia bacterium]